MMTTAMLTHQTGAGFYKAPVCKGLIGTMLVTCTAIHVPMLAHLRQYLSCEIGSLTLTQLWRLLFNRLTFVYSKDILCSILVIYNFRIFERRMGSRKFASHIIGTALLTTILEVSLILLSSSSHYFEDFHDGFLPPGMYALLFPLFVDYYCDIPQTTASHFLGLALTPKTMSYLLGVQIASTTPATIVASLSGIIAGVIYRILKLRNYVFIPEFLAKLCDKTFGWILGSRKPKDGPMGATLELQRQEQADLWEQQYLFNRAQDIRQARGQGYSERLVDANQGGGGFLSQLFGTRRRLNAAQSPRNSPSEQNIQVLVEMGFDRSLAVEALRSCSNDLQTATSILLRQ